MKDNIGQRAKLLRKKAGLDQRELAKLVGTSAPTISRFENGSNKIALSVCLAIFEALGEPIQSAGIELSEVERDYIWMLTALDAMRIKRLEGPEQDYHYVIRHSVRSKLFEK